MQYTNKYKSPIGNILLAADDTGLTGLWFEGQKYFDFSWIENCKEKETDIFNQAKKWLDTYFAGKIPNFEVPIHFTGSKFQNEIWNILYSIPYGKTMTYGGIAKLFAKYHNLDKMSAQAVGGAVGHNKISIIVPCHRVIGANGNLTGYAGGINKKIALLKIEKSYKSYYFIPKNCKV